MKSGFSPRLEILPPPQRRLWLEFKQVPSEFVLYGGTAIALRLGHRQSIDFDFFGRRDLNLEQLVSDVPFLRNAQVDQREKNTLSVTVERGGPIKVSFFGVPALIRLAAPEIVEENGLQIASVLDLAGTKASVVQVRAEAKDYLDIDALLTQGSVTLSQSLAAARAIYGSTFNPQITLKALSYFGDGNLSGLPEEIRNRLAAAAREVDLDALPVIEPMTWKSK